MLIATTYTFDPTQIIIFLVTVVPICLLLIKYGKNTEKTKNNTEDILGELRKLKHRSREHDRRLNAIEAVLFRARRKKAIK